MAWELFIPPGFKDPLKKVRLTMQVGKRTEVVGSIPSYQVPAFKRDVAALRQDRKRAT